MIAIVVVLLFAAVKPVREGKHAFAQGRAHGMSQFVTLMVWNFSTV